MANGYKRGTEAAIEKAEKKVGQLYIATDTGEMFVDISNETRKKITDTSKVSADNNTGLQTESKNIIDSINEVNAIAKGAQKAIIYQDYEDLVSDFNTFNKERYNIGQNFYIITLDVPDIYISGIEDTSVPYTYTTDAAFIAALEGVDHYIQVGYYKFSKLETTKIDLSGYYTSEQVDGLITTTEAKIPTNLKNGQGTNSLYSINTTGEGTDSAALGKWSFAEGRGNNFTVKLVSKDLANNKITVAKYNGDTKVNGAKDIRANAILWIDGAWYYVIAVTKTNPDNTLTLDAVTRDLKDQDGKAAGSHSIDNVAIGTEIHAYMGAAAASCSHVEGNFNNTVWLNSRYEFNEDNVSRQHAEGSRTLATGYCAHVEGENSRAIGNISHAEGASTQARGGNSHAEGKNTIADAGNSHAEGENTQANAVNSHAQGSGTKAGGNNSFAGGYKSETAVDHSFAHGFYVTANEGIDFDPPLGKAVFGHYNEDNPTALLEIGNGSANNHSNALTVTQDGDLIVKDTVHSKNNILVKDHITIGYRSEEYKPAYAKSRFTIENDLSGQQMLIRIGHYANGNGEIYTLFTPKLKNLTTDQEFDISFGETKFATSSTNLKWYMYDASSKYEIIEGGEGIKINKLKSGWAYIQYRQDDIELPAGEYELSVQSNNNNIIYMPTLNILYNNSSINNNKFETYEQSKRLLNVGNGSIENNSNAFTVEENGTAIVQKTLMIGETKINETQLRQLLALLNNNS